MKKHDNFQVNFSLKGFTSIQIGVYIFITSYLIKSILDGFIIDNNPLGMLSPQIVEIVIITLAVFTFLFSSFALYFKGRRSAKRFQFQLWNSTTKRAFIKYSISFLLLFLLLYFLMKQGYIDFITPAFLLIYGIILLLFKNKERKNLYIISGVSVLLAILCIVIPTYWYSALTILGIAHITYGVVVKN